MVAVIIKREDPQKQWRKRRSSRRGSQLCVEVQQRLGLIFASEFGLDFEAFVSEVQVRISTVLLLQY